MIELKTHRSGSDADKQLRLLVVDEAGAGGAHHEYELRYRINANSEEVAHCISFQNGPVREEGINGVTNEVLLAIVEDRLKSFQAGPFACRANASALFGVRRALKALHERTQERVKRGVEGKPER